MAMQPQQDRTLDRYIQEISRHALLTRTEEARLAHVLRDTGDARARERLVVANLRFVVKTANSYRGYGLRLLDLVQEGNMGLMVAVTKFDPAKGFRLVSYAVWWIRAFIQSYILRAWSLVKVGTTQAQRRLFFRLRAERERADRALGGARATAAALATRLRVPVAEVVDMEQRLAERDFSLDAEVTEGSSRAHVSLLADAGPSPEQEAIASQLVDRLRLTVARVMAELNAKERHVVTGRLLRDEPPTLQQMGVDLAVSRERVRQIECNVVRKLGRALEAA